MLGKHTLCALLLLLAVPLLKAEEDVKPIPIAEVKREKPVSFFEEVLPILEEKCLACHSLSLAEGDLNLEEVSTMLKGGKRGPAIVPGRGADSLLVKVAARLVEPHMPPPDRKDYPPLTPEELGLIKLWIDQGAKDDSDEEEEDLQLSPLPSHLRAILAAELSPDGRYLAVGRGNLVQVYDTESGTEVVTLTGHLDFVQSLAWSPDGKLLASGSYRLVKVWRAPGNELRATLRDPVATKGVAAHAGSATKVLASEEGLITAGLDGQIKWWDVETGELKRQLASPVGPPVGLALAADGRILVAGSSSVMIVDSSGKVALQRPSKVPIVAMAYSADGQRVAIGLRDGTVLVVDYPELHEQTTIRVSNQPIHGVLFGSRPTEVIAWTADGMVSLWDVTQRKKLRQVRHGQGAVRAVALSPNGNLLATAGEDKQVRLWTYADWQPYPKGQQRTLGGFAAAVRSLTFSSDGTRLAAASDAGRIRAWEVSSGRLLQEFTGHIGSVYELTYVRGGRLLASAGADRTVRLWDCSTEWVEAYQITSVFSHRVLALDFSPDGRWLAAGGGEPSRFGEIKILDARTGELVRDLGEVHSDTVFALDFSPDGTMLASCGADKIARVFDLASGQELRRFEGHTHHVLDVVWRWDGRRLVTCGADNVLKVWDFQTGEQVRTIPRHAKHVTSLAVVPRTNQVVSCGADSRVLRINTDNGGVVRAFGGARDFLYAVSVDQNGRWVVAAGQASTVWIWELNSGKLVRVIEGNQ